MNKKYIAPEVSVFDFNVEGMIAASGVTMEMNQDIQVDQLSDHKSMWDGEYTWE